MRLLMFMAILLVLPLANAFEMNSSSFQLNGALESGKRANSTSFILDTAAGITGDANSSNFIICLGFHCSSLHLQVNSITATDSGWNSQFNFTSTVTVTDNVLVNVTLWASDDNFSWSQYSQQQCTGCNNYSTSFDKSDYACSDIGIKYIKVNATTGFLTHEAYALFNITRGVIHQSDIEFVEGANSTVDANGEQNITIRIFNRFNSTYEANVSSRAWISDINRTSTIICSSNTSGHCKFVFRPACSFEESRKDLIAGIYDDACFLDVNTTPQYLDIIDPSNTCTFRVMFSLGFNISGPANDRGFADSNQTPGEYFSPDLTKYYTCVDDLSQPEDAVFGLVFTGNSFNSINLTGGDQFTITMTQLGDEADLLLPVTIGSCSVIGNSTPTTGLPPAFNEFLTERSQVQLILDYPVDIVGDISKGGTFTLVIEKNESDGNQILIDVI